MGRRAMTQREGRRSGLSVAAVLVAVVAMLASLLALPAVAEAQAAPAAECTLSPVACENQLPGNPQWEWDTEYGDGDPTIVGFTTDISVDAGGRVDFKIDTDARAYTIDIYRMGYYQGNGARFIDSVEPSATLPQNQDDCISDSSTGLVDCGNWKVSASWNVPDTAVSGVYFAKIQRTDNGGASHIMFVVRNDDSHADVVFQTSDTTWQAYNRYGGNNFYGGQPAGRAYKLSYNRPFTTRDDVPNGRDWVMANEYPAIRWLERNGYDVTYQSGVDTDRYGSRLTNHKVFLSVGHDEYWSGDQRANVEAARDAGVNLMFLSGNEVYWKTRYEPSIDGTLTDYRTLVSYKETWGNAKIDPSPEWTGTWRDPRFSPPADGGNPENGLTGTMYMANCCDTAIEVPAADGKMRLWRNTSVATQSPGAKARLAESTLGYEYDAAMDNGFQPDGLIKLSTTDTISSEKMLDWGNTTGTGPVTHSLTLYRAPSGALVFGAGTVQWTWGLDANHDGNAHPPEDPRMQQAMVNLFADMGVQPTTRQSNLVAATKSTDTVGPTVTIDSPTTGADLAGGTTMQVTGTATDTGGGRVGGVEVSTDGGDTWHPAQGRESWTYTWSTNGLGSTDIKVRATDDSANIGPVAQVGVDVSCPCTIFGSEGPFITSTNDSSPNTLGVKFQSDVDGFVTGVRFYKGAGNTGTHTGSLWSASGQRLATGQFAGETADGWQTLLFDAPVPVTADTTYVASYYAPNGHYAADLNAFNGRELGQAPLRALASTASSPNGVYADGNAFPNAGFGATNYGVDVVFEVTPGPDTKAPVIADRSPASGATDVKATAPISATFSESVVAGSVVVGVSGPSGVVAGSSAYVDGTRTVTFTPSSALAASSSYTVSVSGAKDAAGNTMAPVSWSFTTAAAVTCPCSVFSSSATPAVAAANDADAVELGMKWRSDVDGQVTGVRFYKGTGNSGTHTGSLWSSTGQRLATGTFINESATGWQTLQFSSPVSVTANTTYVVSYYAPNGRYALTASGLSTAVDNGVLHALSSSSSGGNGVFRYGSGGGFPSDSWQSANYWVDVVFSTSTGGPPPVDTTAPTVTARVPASGATGVSPTSTVSATFSESVVAGSVVVGVSGPSGVVAGSSAYVDGTRTVTFTPSAALAASSSYTVSVSGAKDAAGNTMAPVSWSFTTAAAVTCPCSVFSSSATPAVAAANDADAVELGMKWRSDVDGQVTGVRFYKGTGNSGTHTGSLWSSTGQRLATGTFINESATGWQTLQFSSPVSVTANTTYVVSYYAPNGRYALTASGLSTAVDNGVLHALSSSSSGGNGVFRYGSGGGFPSDSWQSANYWVDVVFSTSTGGPPPVDTTAPTVTARVPASSATGVAVSSAISATFSESVVAGSVVVGVSGPSGVVAGSSAYVDGTRTVTFTPSSALAASSSYTVSVSGAKDAAGNTMAPVSWSFTTAAPVDTTAPTVTARVPASGATGVSPTSTVSATFSESVVAGSVVVGVSGPSGVVAGSSAYVDGTRTVTFTPSAALAASSSYTVSVSGAKDAAGNTMAPVSWSFTTAAPVDTTAPTVTARVPASSATGVAVSSAISATFSESVVAGSVVVGVSGPSGVVAGSSAYVDGTRTVTFTPSSALAASSSYTVSVSGAKDAAGNTMAPVSWSFTTAAAVTCPCSVFSSSATPAVAAANDADAVELGMKWRSDVDGQVTGVRFYKGTGNSGTHTGSLWSSTGQRLATGTFINESATGWQTLQFSSPVSVTANTTYVVSYYAPNGRYALTASGLSTAVDNGVLHALSSSSSGGNGVFRYGSGGGFPSDSWQSANYWVDVVFSTSTGGPPPVDTTAPTVTARVPASGATGVSPTSTVSATFSESVVAGSVVVGVSGPSGVVAGSSAYVDGTRTVTFTPSAALAASSSYTVSVSGAKDAAGNTMAPVSWSFTTAAAVTCPCSVFSSSATPAVAAATDAGPLTVGMRFSPSVDGTITGVRFYKGTGNTGTHTGALWSSTGQLLSSVNFIGESATGWQQAQFTTPVPVTAGTEYVVSYFAPNGRYAVDVNYFATPRTNGPLEGRMGTFVYGASSAFPTNSFKSANYWVDVTFSPS